MLVTGGVINVNYFKNPPNTLLGLTGNDFLKQGSTVELRGYSYNGYKIVLIRASAVVTHFDQTDLANRQNSDKRLELKYHTNWIYRDFFSVPSFYIQKGKAFVGIGRHRFSLLSQLLEAFPAGFEEYNECNKDSLGVYDEIVVRDIMPNEMFEYPDLPIEDLGVDVNGKPTWKEHL